MLQHSAFHPAMLDVVLPVGASDDPPYNGTAFLYSKTLSDGDIKGFIVRNKRVIEGIGKFPNGEVMLHVNHAIRGSIPLPTRVSSWTFHDSKDVAVCMVGFQSNTQSLMQRNYLSDSFYAPRHSLTALSIGEGNVVVVVGFPLGLGSHASIIYPFVRQGIVSQVQPWIDGNSDSIVVDASAYPGSSGSPVFVRPEGTDESRLLGILTSYIPYREELISVQTGDVMSISQENSGLAHVTPVEFIEEAIAKQMRR